MKIRRLFAILLALCLVVSMVPGTVLPVRAAEHGTIDSAFVNPVYQDVLDVEDLSKPEIRPNSAISPMAESDFSDYVDFDDAQAQLRKELEAWNSEIHIKVYTTESDPNAFLEELFSHALIHVAAPAGCPTGGDYLNWQIAGASVSGDVYQSDSVYYLDVTYHVTYLTTVEQEAELDTAVKTLLDELDLYEASDYSKLKGIYDYVCANVTYDYDNLENEEYTLKYTAYAALVNKTAVCQGYANLLYRLALELGVDCRIVAGYQTSTGYGHAWNLARIGERYYNLDATWDAGYSTYDFFLVGNDNCYDHTLFAEYKSICVMSSENYNPYSSGTLDNGLFWSYDGVTGLLTVEGTGDMSELNESRAPWIGRRKEICKIVIGEGVTSVGWFVGCEKVREVVLPSTLKTIHMAAFAECDKLETINLPDGLETIEGSAFVGCQSIKSMKIPDSVTTLGTGVFSSCFNMEQIEFSDGITVLPSSVCDSCEKLTSVKWPANLIEIGNCAFYYCRGLRDIQFPETLESVGASAFAYCTSLKTIEFPGNLKEIGDSAFECYALGDMACDVYFTGHAPTFGTDVFANAVITSYYPKYDTTWTEKVMQQYGGTVTWVPDGRNVSASGTWGDNLTWVLDSTGVLTISGEGEMYEADDPSEYSWYEYNEQIKQVVIESGVTTVAGRAFSSYRNLEKVVLPEGLTSLGRHAFSSTSKLTDIQLPSTLKIIDADCFLMSGIADVTLPEGLETIGAEAFCFSKLTRIVIPDTVTSIGTDAFGQCTSLTSAVLSAGCAELPMGMFRFCAALETVTIPEGVTTIGWSVFSDCGALKNVTLPESLVSIGVDAFENCTSLTEMEIPAGVTTFENPFRGCTNLSSITFLGDAPVPEGQTAFVDNNGFEGVTATIYYPANNETWTEDVMQQYGGTLTWVSYTSGVCGDDLTWTLLDGVLTISGTGEMYDMTDDTHAANSWHPYSDQVEKVIIEDGATSIGRGAFKWHPAVKEIVIPNSVTTIERYAFMCCESLERLEIPASVTKYPYFMAHGCTSMTEVVIPEGVSFLDGHAFSGCTGLTKVEFPSTLKTLEISAFAGCTSLREIWFTGDAPEYLDMVFDEVTATVYYPGPNETWTEEQIEAYKQVCPPTLTWKAYWPNPFTDVSEDRYYYNPVLWAYYNGITSGKTPTTFEPNTTCTRAQVMTFLWAAAGRPEPTQTENPFTDVSQSAYYYKAVLWAVENGITSGTSATTFSPDASCTRNQVVTFLWVYCGRPEPTIENPFTDVEAGKYYYKPILWAYENGITSGKSATTFEPHSPCTRGQIVTFLYQALAEK